MKFKDITAIAMLRLRNRSSVVTIAALSFGIIMLTIVLWLTFSFYFDFQTKAKDTPENYVINITGNATDYIDVRSSTGDEYIKNHCGFQFNNTQFKKFINENDIIWNEIMFNIGNGSFSKEKSTYTFSVNEDNKIDEDIAKPSEYYDNNLFAIKFYESDKLYPDIFNDYIQKKFGYPIITGNRFGNERDEVIVSEIFLENIGLNPAQALNAKLSLSINYNNFSEYSLTCLDDDNVFENNHIYTDAANKNKIAPINGDIKIFSNYRIKGIISKEYYNINDLTKNDSHIWMKKDSLVTSDGENTLPLSSIQKIHDGYGYGFSDTVIYTYKNTDYITESLRITADGAFYPFFVNNGYSDSEFNNKFMPIKRAWKDYGSFKELNAVSSMLDKISVENGNIGDYFDGYTQGFLQLREMNNIISVIVITLSLIGFITLLTILINYGNIMSFNARKRSKYMHMMVCMGIKESDKKNLLWLEMFLLLLLALLISLILSAAIIGTATAIINALLQRNGALVGFKLKFGYYPLAFVVIALIMSFIYSGLAAAINKRKNS